jgi:hypothetical protein
MSSETAPEQNEIQSILDEHFLTSRSWVDTDDSRAFVFEFGLSEGSSYVMDLMTLAFRCNESTGAVLTVSSIGFPRFVRSEMDTMLACSNLTRYRLIVLESKAKAFAELLREDMNDADTEIDLIRMSITDRLKAFARMWMWFFFGIAAAEMAFAVALAALGLYFHGLEEDGSIALWGTFPLCALMLFRASFGVSKGLSYYKKLKSGPHP